MLVRMGLLSRKPGMTPGKFSSYWRNEHAAIVLANPGELLGYVQNSVVDRTQRAIDYTRGTLEVDGITELFYSSIGAMNRSLSKDVVTQWHEDTKNFAASGVALTTLQNTVIPPPRSGRCIKRMALLGRRPDVSAEKFQLEWFNLHAVLVRRLTGVMGYRQNLVIDKPAEVNVDGIVELWFEDAKAIENAFRTDAGTTLMTHAREFIGEISTFLVEPEVLLPEPA